MVSITLSCVGRIELNGSPVIQLQNTHQFHPEDCDKLCSSLVVTESWEIKIPLLQKGEWLWSCSRWRGPGGLRWGCLQGQAVCRESSSCTLAVGRVVSPALWITAVVSQTKGPFLQSLTKTVCKCLESPRRKRAGVEWPWWCPLPAVSVQLVQAPRAGLTRWTALGGCAWAAQVLWVPLTLCCVPWRLHDAGVKCCFLGLCEG